MPEEIGNCASLKTLVLHTNPRLGGALPASIGRLQQLWLCWTFSTAIDNVDALAGCASLKQFGAHKSGLTHFPALAPCTALEMLYLFETMIQGEAPAWLADLPALKNLVLPQNDGFSISPTLKEQLVVRGVEVKYQF